MSDVLHEIEDLEAYLDLIVETMKSPNATEPLRRWTEEASGELGRRMASGQSPTGKAHPPLKASTLKKRKNKGGPPLIDSGNMMLSVVGGGSGHTVKITGNQATLGTRHNKGKSSPPVSVVHQLGSTKRKIPARPFMGVNQTMAIRGEELIAEHIERQIASI